MTLKDKLEKNKYDLLDKANVTGVGIGYKVKDGETTDEKAILVFVKEKKDPIALDAQDLVPAEVDGEKTDVQEGGEFEALNVHREKHRPVKAGGSAMWYKGSACTAGAKVYRGSTPYLLGNAHCYLPHWSGAKKGDPILQPSPSDGGTSNDKIGEAYEVTEITFDGSANPYDASLVKLSEDMDDELLGIGDIKTQPADVSLGDVLIKSGRTTGVTSGKVLAVNVTARVNYQMPDGTKKLALFEDQIFTDNEQPFIDGGDSSSLVINGNRNPVGLVFAASSTIGILSPIQKVMDGLNFSFEPEVSEGYMAAGYVEIDPKTLTAGNRASLAYNLNFRTSPELGKDNKITTLPKGSKVEIIEYAGEHSGHDWVKVKLLN